MLIQVLEYLALGLLLAAFWMRLPIRLRGVAIASNVAFIAYAAVDHRIALLIVNALLLPLNVLRLLELRQVLGKIKRAVDSDLSMDWLRPMMRRTRLGAGEYVFHQGDPQGDIYLVVSGIVRIVEMDVKVGAGELLGEMAVFTPRLRRTMSARCETDVEMLSMPYAQFLKIYYENPDFGIYLVRLIARRLLQDVDLVRQLGVERADELERLRGIAKIDDTTGFGDRAAIAARLSAEWSRASRSPAPLTVIALHLRADEVGEVELTQVAAALSWCLSRASDFLGRDGNEFVAILPHTDAAAAATLSTEIEAALAALALRCSFLIGASTSMPSRDAAPASLLERARDALAPVAVRR
jgi:CRP-like cAMP-binding protein